MSEVELDGRKFYLPEAPAEAAPEQVPDDEPSMIDQLAYGWDSTIVPTQHLIRVAASLFSRLAARGVPPNHVPGLIPDVCSIVGDGGFFTSSLVNQRLERLGWGKEALDETTCQLIVSILEDEWGYRVRRVAVR